MSTKRKKIIAASLWGMFIIYSFGAWGFVPFDGSSPPEPFFYVLMTAALFVGMPAIALTDALISQRGEG